MLRCADAQLLEEVDHVHIHVPTRVLEPQSDLRSQMDPHLSRCLL